jgi:hypothetical protein
MGRRGYIASCRRLICNAHQLPDSELVPEPVIEPFRLFVVHSRGEVVGLLSVDSLPSSQMLIVLLQIIVRPIASALDMFLMLLSFAYEYVCCSVHVTFLLVAHLLSMAIFVMSFADVSDHKAACSVMRDAVFRVHCIGPWLLLSSQMLMLVTSGSSRMVIV